MARDRRSSGGDSIFTRLFVYWLLEAVVLGVTAAILDQVTVSGVGSLLLAAAVFGALNTIVKPLLRLITLPLAIISFGIAWFFVSLLMLFLTKEIVNGFQIHGFWTYVEATIIVWVVNVALELIPGPWQINGESRRLHLRR